ncbi:hypothetical protein [Limnoglobus roseus]|uniref:TIGR02996 domain-containing protein n=1 Tax=Limnoglobus roseus TaxID=2598579 RepID=A0A5C1APD7_9BACT|nr:hypothetical protein [Limnoglobus roseus]QEL19074.1 hypothetical protein PX52LOC_06131 [Limnoglobus roseus]
MQTENEFQARLDARPSDWATRLELASRLAASNDPRWVGYRALGLLRKWPLRESVGVPGQGWRFGQERWSAGPIRAHAVPFSNALPEAWYEAVLGAGELPTRVLFLDRETRRGLEDLVALKFPLARPRDRDLRELQFPLRFEGERGFHDHLDANPSDSDARLVLADWLEDIDDARAAGYRALGNLKRVPYWDENVGRFHFFHRVNGSCSGFENRARADGQLPTEGEFAATLPMRWFDRAFLTPAHQRFGESKSAERLRIHKAPVYTYSPTPTAEPVRRVLEDRVAAAFARLGADDQAAVFASVLRSCRTKGRYRTEKAWVYTPPKAAPLGSR